MAIVQVARERVKPGQVVRFGGLTYNASAQRNGFLYLWREVPGGLKTDRACTRTDDKLVELVVPDVDVAKYH